MAPVQPLSLLLGLSLATAGPSPRDIDPAAAVAPVVPDGAGETKVRAPAKSKKAGPRRPPPAPPAATKSPTPTPKTSAPPPKTSTPPTTVATPTPPPKADAGKAEAAVPPPRGTKCFPARGPCYRLSATGIGLVVGGAVVAGTGAAFLAIPDYPDPDEAIYDRSLRPPGAVLLATGATVLVTGVVMIVVGHLRHKKQSSRATAWRWR